MPMKNIYNHRYQLLRKQEIEEIYALPKLNQKEREKTFGLNSDQQKFLTTLHTLSSKVMFILQLGFFKLKKRFFSQEELSINEKDKQYIIETYFPLVDFRDISMNVTKPTRLSHQAYILRTFGYRRCTGEVSLIFRKEVARIIFTHANSSYVIREIIRFLERQKVVIPAYSTLQDVIGSSIQSEMNRSGNQLNAILDKEKKRVIDDLLEKQGTFLNELTLLKRDPKDFSLKEIKKTIKNQKKIEELCPFVSIESLCVALKISKNNMIEYAKLVNYYKVDQLKGMNPLTRRLLLFCFIHIRCRIINDHLVKAFLYRVNKYINDARRTVIDEAYYNRISKNKNMKKVSKILEFFLDKVCMPDHMPFKKVRDKAFSILDEAELDVATKVLSGKSCDEKSLLWAQFDKMSISIRRNLRPLVLSLKFDGYPSCIPLIREINLLQKKLKNSSNIRLSGNPDLFSIGSVKYIYAKKNLVNFRYEFELYRKISEKIISGDLFIPDSLSYRSFEKDIIDKNSWKKKEQIIDAVGLPKLKIAPKDLVVYVAIDLLYKPFVRGLTVCF